MDIKNLYHVLTMVENLFNAKDGKGLDQELQHRLLEVKDQIILIIRKYPMGALGSAAAAGFIFGKLLKR
ncbi:MAG: hypothetical protein WD266_07070 [Balneolales bacterium]